MSNDSCYYDCSNPPGKISPYPDISGTGVVVSYVATAGIVVLIITVSYFVAFSPYDDPFLNTRVGANVAPSQHQPNPVDVIILSMFTKGGRQLRRLLGKPEQAAEQSGSRNAKRSHLKQACKKCIQSMSDLQILTGVSILLSAFLQLPCGLSAYHWQVMSYLAWFSSLTHLSCLTFLRDHLYNHPGERLWRLMGMGIVMLLLLAALVPTGNYNWPAIDGTFPTPVPSDYAICYLGWQEGGDEFTFASTILSMFILAVGFAIRVVKVIKTLSVDVFQQARHWTGGRLQAALLFVYVRLKLDRATTTLSIRRTLIYWPLLATFLAVRVALDTWLSMFVEVWWLVAAFIFGVLNLTSVLGLADGGNSDWTFGQIVPVILLAAPLLAVLEFMMESKPDKKPTEEIDAPASHMSSNTNVPDPDPDQGQDPDPALKDHPARNYYELDSWMRYYVVFTILNLIVNTSELLVFAATENTKLIRLLVPSQQFWAWLPLNQFVILTLFIGYALLMKHLDFQKLGQRLRQPRVGETIAMGFFILMLLIAGGIQTWETLLLVLLGYYVVSCAALGLRAHIRVE